MIIIRSNDGNRGVTEHQSLLTCMDVCVYMGGILGNNLHICMVDTGISLVQNNNIISKAS